MGLKSDIYAALEKNIGKEHIKNSSEGKKKVDTLADDLSIAIRDFILSWILSKFGGDLSDEIIICAPLSINALKV